MYMKYLIDIRILLCILTGIYEVFVGHKNFYFGKQPDLLPGTETVSFSVSYIDICRAPFTIVLGLV